MIERTRRRGKRHPRLTQAVNRYLSESRRTVSGLANEIERWASAHSRMPDTLSIGGLRSTITNITNENPVMDANAEIIRLFFQSDYPELIPTSKLDEDYLDLDKFFFSRGNLLRELGPFIGGRYQTYAQSTSIPHRPPLYRRGLIEFEYKSHNNSIIVSEKQYRPQHEDIESIILEWEGYGAPIHDIVVAIMRTKTYNHNTTPLFYIFWDIKSNSKGQITSMRANSIGIDPEVTWPTFPLVYVERIQNGKTPVVDFTGIDNIPTHVRTKIYA